MASLGAITLAACAGSPAHAQNAVDPGSIAGPRDGSAWVIFGTDTVVAEVAATADERARGLQDRSVLPPGTGMLFTFDEARVRTLWMKDTPLDLDVAFLDDDLRVFQITRMLAHSTDLHDSTAPVTMLLEVPAGWFDSVGVRVGAQAEIVMPPS